MYNDTDCGVNEVWSVRDKMFLLVCGFVLLFMHTFSIFSVIALLAAVTVSALNGVYTGQRFVYTTATVYLLLCIFRSEFLFFIPLVFYDVFIYNLTVYTGAVLFPLLFAIGIYMGIPDKPSDKTIVTLLFLMISYLICRRSVTLKQLRQELVRQRDSGKETALLLERKNRDLIEKQDIEIRLATLAERNRIAREIHDNVGHMLSRSILQVGALITVSKEPAAQAGLSGLRDTLSEAMDSIRTSVHDLHNDSIDLSARVQALVREFTYCPVDFDYDVESVISSGIKYAFLSIIRESLSNIAKHSGATRASITLREHPALFQLIIQDNGQGITGKQGQGMGINSISERVSALDGIVHIDGKNGFRIFISIPKKETA